MCTDADGMCGPYQWIHVEHRLRTEVRFVWAVSIQDALSTTAADANWSARDDACTGLHMFVHIYTYIHINIFI